MKKHLLKITGVLALLLAFNLPRAQAQFSIWTGPATGGEWNTAADWSGGVPGVGINATIGAGSNVSYSLPMAAAGFGTLTNNGILTVNTNGFNPTGVIMLNAGSSASNGRFLLNTGAVVNVTGNLGYCSNAVVSMTVGTTLAVSGTLIIGSDTNGANNGTATIGAYGSFTNFGGSLTASAVNLNPRNQSITTSCRLVIAGGTNNLGAVTAQRSPGGANAPPTLGTDGLVISNGFVNTTSISVGNNAHGIMYLVGGTVTNTGTLTLKNATSTRPARFLQTGGLFVDTDPNLVVLSSSGTGGDTVYSIQGGTNMIGGIEFGNSSTTGTSYFTNAALIYVGSQGIVSNGLMVLVSALNNGATFGATADWMDTAAMRLIGGTFNFSPADPSGNGHVITWDGVLSGAGGLLVTNAGTLVLGSTNTYTGNTTIGLGGNLQLGDGANVDGVVLGTITNNGILTAANPTLATLTASVIGSGSFIETGPGTLIVGTNTYTGSTTINGGTLQLGDGATFDGAVSGNITDNATLGVANPTAQTLTSVISGSGGLVKSGAGVLTLGIGETYAGSTTVNAGTVVVGAGGSLASTENVTIASGALLDVSGSTSGQYTLGSGYVFTAGHTSGSGPDFNGNLTSSGSVTVPAASIFTLHGNLSLLNGGSGVFNLGSSPGSGGTIALGGGTLNLSGVTTIQIDFSILGVGTYPLISGAGSVVGGAGNLNLVLNGSVGSGGATLQVTGTGVNLVVTGNPHFLVWQGNGSANYWDNNSANTDWSNAVTHVPDYFITGYYVTFDNTGAANQPVLNDVVSPAWTTINGTSSYTLSGGGHIASGTLTNNSTGTLYVQTANTYNGGTVINTGTVEVDSGGAIGIGPVLNNAALTFNATYGNNVGLINGSGTVTVENGNETLSAANTYTGGTTIASGTLQAGVANAVPGGTVAGDVNDNGTLDLNGYNDTINGLSGSGTVDTYSGGTPTLTVGGNGDGGTFSGTIQNSAGTLNLAKAGSGVEVLANANTYSGSTTIANGTLSLAAGSALPVSTTVILGGSGTTGVLDLGGNSQQVAGLAAGTGAVGTNQIIGNSSTGSPATLIVSSTGTVTYGGGIQDSVNGGNQSTALTINGGSLVLNGTNIYSGATTINSGNNTMLTVSGGLLAGSTLVMNSANISLGFLLSAGTASFSNSVTFSADNGDNANYMDLTGGSLNTSNFLSGRCNLSFTTQPATGQASSEGIYVNGATMNVTNMLGVGGANSAESSTSLRMDAGAINVGGTTTVTIDNATRWSIMDINGGVFSSADKTGAGIQIGGVFAGAEAELLIRGGVVSANTITLGDGTQTSGTDLLILTNSTLYLGAGGIVSGNPAPTYTESVKLTSATIGASGSWSSTLPISLANAMTFQAADTNGNPFNITLDGVLSGSSTLTKTGGGALTLGGTNSYSGNTFINAGTLALGANGSMASLNVLVGTNSIFDVSQVTSGYTLGGSQTLKGFGTVTGLLTAASGSTIYPGSNVLTGTLTLAGGLTENGGVYNSFDLTNILSLPNSDLLSVPGALTVSGVNTILINGTVLAGGVYPLITYGTFSGGTNNFAVSGASGVISNNASTKTIYFIAQANERAPTNVTWLGSIASQNWDSGISTNWLNTGTSLPDVFVVGDNALFSNLGAVHPLVNLVGTVTPGSITVNTTSNYTFTGTGSIGGSGGLTLGGSTLTILTTNNFTGPTVINGGVLVTTTISGSGSPSGIGAATADPGNLILNGGTLVYDGGAAFTDHGITLTNVGGTFDVAAGAALNLDGSLTGGGTLTKTDSGTLVLGAANTYTGNTFIGGGVLQVSSAASVSTNTITFTNATLAYPSGAGITVANPLDFTPGTTNMIIATSGSGANPISGGNWSGGGVLLVSNTFNPYTVNGILDAFTGTISLVTPNQAGFRFNSGGGNSSFGSTNATFDLSTNAAILLCRNSGTMNLGALEGGVNTSVQGQDSGSGTVIWSVGYNNLNTIFAGIICNYTNSAAVSALTKVGTGKLTLEGQNLYTGATVIQSGVLALAYNATNSVNGSIDDSPSIVLSAGAVLDVSGRNDDTYLLNSSQTLTGPGTIRGSLDASGIIDPNGTLLVTNLVTLENSCTLNMNLNRAFSPNSDRLVSSNSIIYGGTLQVTSIGATLQVGDTFTLFHAPAYSGSFSTVVLPALADGQYWNTNELAVNGTISVAAPAPPSFNGITVSGQDIVLNATGGTAGEALTVLSSTNLALPLAQWTVVTTGNFDGSGNFNYTVTGALSSSQPQQYYIFQLNP